jgi:dGTPase
MTGYSASDKERRGFESPNDASGRTPFARDRDRILYTSAFRALAGKTQVVSAEEMGRFHTRLTHSLRVAQLGRSLATRIGTADLIGFPDPDIVEAACLAHDIGHPPFGHAGEDELCKVIDENVAKAHLHDGFEGNAQTFRIVTRIATKAGRERLSYGLNLTRATLRAIVKYPWLRGGSSAPKYKTKWSAYSGDSEYLKWVLQDNHNTDLARWPIEEQIMDWSDDVAYACHDMEDFYRSGAIPLDKLLGPERDGREQEKFLSWLERDGNWNAEEWGDYDGSRVAEVLVRLSQLVIVDATYDGSPKMEAKVKFSASQLISHFMDNVGANNPMRFGYEAELVVSEDLRFECEVLKRFAWCFIIQDRRLKIQQAGQRRIMREILLWHFNEPDLLPEHLREGTNPLRAACDHVASLSERRAYELHRRLSGEQLGYITDMV